jgi:ABC-type transporter Mla MlaB component
VPRSVSLRISAPLEHAALPALFARTCALLEDGDAQILRVEVAGVDADTAAIDALARLALAARRRGRGVRLCGASDELLALVAFVGLADVLREGP